MNKITIASLITNVLLIAVILLIISKLGGFRYAFFKMKNRGIAGVYEHRKNLFQQMPNTAGEIIFLGDSMTEYGEWVEFFGNPNIRNRGIAGDVTDGLLNRLDEVTSSLPSKVFLMIGVNDLLFHPPEKVIANYEKILTQITDKSPSTQIYVQSILPVNNDLRNNGVTNADILKINTGIKALAKSKSLIYIDLHPKYVNKEGKLPTRFTVDGIHLNGAGYMIWKAELAPYLAK